MSTIWMLIVGIVLAVAAWRWAMRGVADASRVALVAVLGTTASAVNVIVPIPSVELTTTVVLSAALVLGLPTGIAVAIVTVVGSSLGGGIGAWTTWQVIAGALIALVGAAAGRLGGREADWSSGGRLFALGFVAGACALTWDVIVTAGGLASYAPTAGSTMQQLVAALLLGAAFTVVHVVFTILVTILCAPSLLHALQRAHLRLAGGDTPCNSRRGTREPLTSS